MLGILCPPCQVEQKRCSGNAHYWMTDFLLSVNSRELESSEECQAYSEEDLLTCPCSSCRIYRLRKQANQVYSQHYDAEMEQVLKQCQDPYYTSTEYLNSNENTQENHSGHSS